MENGLLTFWTSVFTIPLFLVTMPTLFAQSNTITKTQSSHQINIQSYLPSAEKMMNVDCNQGDDPNYYENGMNITAGGSRAADDFYVSPDNILNIDKVELVVITPVEYFELMNFNFYEDAGGLPGDLVASVTERAPSTIFVDPTVWGFNAFTVQVDINLDFEGGPDGAVYWMQPEVIISDLAYWESTTAGVLGSPAHISEDNGPWTPEETGAHGVFKLLCDDVVGVDDYKLSALTYYPNPAKDILYLKSDLNIASVTVVNVLGQQVMNRSYIDNNRIDISGLTTGTYMLRISFEDGTIETFKLLKE